MAENVKPKILIVAQNATPKFGGEAFIPLKYFQILRDRGFSVKLIAHARNRADLQAVFGMQGQDILYVEDSIFHRVIWRCGSLFPARVRDTVFGNMMNLVNDLYQRRLIWGLVRQREVDVIHQPIPVSPRAPSSIYGFGVPVVIGPMNGGMNFPPGYNLHESRRIRMLMRFGRRVAQALNVLVPGKRKAAVLLVANSRTRAALPVGHPRVLDLVENGVDLSIWYGDPSRRHHSPAGRLRLVFIGRLVAWKALDITLEAVRLARQAGVAVSLEIIGDGPERQHLEVHAASLGLSELVQFHGFKTQSACVDILMRADALILNSLWECGGAVVIEAMSLGLPVIASDWGGPADYLDDDCGILVSPVPKDDFPVRLAQAIDRLASDPAARQRMGAASQAKAVTNFDWQKKVDRILEIYAIAASRR